MDDVLKELAKYLNNQAAEAQRSAKAHRNMAAECAELRAGLDRSLTALRSRGRIVGDLELFIMTRIAEAAKSEAENLKLALNYEAEMDRHIVRAGSLTEG